jgi:hypothetical protein
LWIDARRSWHGTPAAEPVKSSSQGRPEAGAANP